jgi:RNA polymerase sigma-70 factor, ECF subfamily
VDSSALNQFLASIERRAFRTALLSVHDDQAALDLVQTSMMRLAEKYGHHLPDEWPLLFHRILQNAILDHHRRQKVRRAWVTLLGDLKPGRPGLDDSDAGQDLMEQMPAPAEAEPERRHEQSQTLSQIEQAVSLLPLRQRQAFLLRYWEDMDIAQTAHIMGCSEGSVKTHCSRAVKALAQTLSEFKSSLKDLP